jgi:uncharacterized protein (DUF58 family)
MIEGMLQRVERIAYHVSWHASHMRLGPHASRVRGAGLHFDQLKEAYDGASMRLINWSATARRGGTPLLVNTYYEEKDVTVMLLVDLSASMHFGSTRLSKQARAAEISASLVYSALLEHDRIGLLGFTAGVDLYAPPRQARAYQRTIPEAILYSQPKHPTASFDAAVGGLEARVKQRALVFLLSDFLTDDISRLSHALARLQARYDLIPLVVTDPREEAMPRGHARMPMRDLETGQRTVYYLSPFNRRRIEAAAHARHTALQQLFHHLGMAHVVVSPHSNYVADLMRLFLQWHHRRPQI